MENQSNKFLGTEKIGKLLSMFSIPCVISLIIQALYNLVDQIFIGHCNTLGATGNAATGIVYPITVIALGIGLWLGDGAGACMSLNQGRNNAKGSSKSVGNAIIFGIIASIVLMVLMFCFKQKILKGIGASGVILDFSMEYSTFIFFGLIFFILASVMNPIIRADGSPKYALIAMVTGAIINIILDPIFIYIFKMGMTGAALATFIGQTITFILHFVYFFKTKTFKLSLESFVPRYKEILVILKFGISSFLTQIAIVIISIINNKLLNIYSVESGYDVNITQGVITLAFKVFGIIVSIIVGIACGGQPILGYNYGAKKYKRVRETLKYITILTVIVGIVATLLFELCPQVFLFIFGNGGNGVNTEDYKNFTILTFRIYLGLILFTCLIKMFSIFFQAIGKPIISTIISMLRDVIILVPAAIILCNIGGIKSLLWSAPISDFITLIITILFIILMLKKLPTENYDINDEKYNISKSKEGIIITIAREHGTRGRAIGEALAMKLNIPFYDKKLTSLVAIKSGLSNEYVNQVEEGNINYINNLYISLDVCDNARKAQKEVLTEIAKKGSCVIVGRCADVVLNEYKLCRIFINAPLEYRIKQVMKNYKDDEILAKKNIIKSDKHRKQYYEIVTGQIWGESKYYDLCINSSIGIDETVEMICLYLKLIK